MDQSNDSSRIIVEHEKNKNETSIPKPLLKHMRKASTVNEESQKENIKESTPIKQQKLFSYFTKVPEKKPETLPTHLKLYGTQVGIFKPIQLKPGMVYHQLSRPLFDIENFDRKIFKGDLNCHKEDIAIWKNAKTNPEIHHSNIKRENTIKFKFIKFSENFRPPYYGTWSKKTNLITGRKPFEKDPLFDYDVDSDLEWEEEEPGEDIAADSDSDECPESSDTEDDFIVPTGYLSEDEGIDDSNDNSPVKNSTVKQTKSNQQFKKLKPLIYCKFCENNNIKTEESDCSKWEARFIQYPMVEKEDVVDLSYNESPRSQRTFPEECKYGNNLVMPTLVQFSHNNTSLKKIVIEFKNFIDAKYPEKYKITNKQIELKIREITEFKSKKYVVGENYLKDHAPGLLDK